MLTRKCWSLEKRKCTLEMWVEGNSAWEESNWKRYITQWQCGAYWWRGQQDTPKFPILLKVAFSNHKEQVRVGKVTSKFLKLSSPKPHYKPVFSKMIWISWPWSSKLALPSSPTLLLPLTFEGKKPRGLTPLCEVHVQVLVVFAEIK